MPVLSAALFARFSSRGEALYADKLLSAMRQAFGGHVEQPVDEERSSEDHGRVSRGRSVARASISG